jgi:hypothetical protein
MTNILELFAISTRNKAINWKEVIAKQYCPYLEKTCVKTRKSYSDIAIGTCSVKHGTQETRNVNICPHRFLEKKQIFMDCIHLLTLHEPGNEIHMVPEITIPGGNIDFVLASVRKGSVMDFVGVELQALDTTGTLWPQRQLFLRSVGVDLAGDDILSSRSYGINWKMTAKTTLMQLHHKIETFELLGKHLVLVLQDCLLEYMNRVFSFDHVQDASLGNAMHIHAYALQDVDESVRLELVSRKSTNTTGIARCLGLQASPDTGLEFILSSVQSRISEKTLLTI